MIFCIVVVLAAFYWLMYETNWLAIRLPFGKPLTVYISIDELLTLAISVAIVIMATKYLGKLCKKDADNGGPADWYETVGSAGPKYGAWSRYIEADRQAKEEALGGEK